MTNTKIEHRPTCLWNQKIRFNLYMFKNRFFLQKNKFFTFVDCIFLVSKSWKGNRLLLFFYIVLGLKWRDGLLSKLGFSVISEVPFFPCSRSLSSISLNEHEHLLRSESCPKVDVSSLGELDLSRVGPIVLVWYVQTHMGDLQFVTQPSRETCWV